MHEFLQPHRSALLGPVATVDQQEVRWHLAQLLPRLGFGPAEVDEAVAVLEGFPAAESEILVASAVSALAELALAHPRLRDRVIALVRERADGASPAIRKRSEGALDDLDASSAE